MNQDVARDVIDPLGKQGKNLANNACCMRGRRSKHQVEEREYLRFVEISCIADEQKRTSDGKTELAARLTRFHSLKIVIPQAAFIAFAF